MRSPIGRGSTFSCFFFASDFRSVLRRRRIVPQGGTGEDGAKKTRNKATPSKLQFCNFADNRRRGPGAQAYNVMTDWETKTGEGFRYCCAFWIFLTFSFPDLCWISGKGYSWTQTMDEVKVRFPIDKSVRGKNIAYSLTPTELSVGVKGQDPVVSGKLGGRVVPGESLWSIEEDGEGKVVEIVMQKQVRHQKWDSVVEGGPAADPFTAETMEKKMLLEKMQRQHPGFDSPVRFLS